MQKQACGGYFALVLALLGSDCGLAQTNLEVNAGLELNLSQPGARSLGMGGAFIGLADDATAAYTNPAGLANLSVTEIAVEGRAWDYNTVFTDSGSATFRNGEIDTGALTESEISSSRGGISFGSLVYPGQKWTAALYFHQLANYEAQISSEGAFAVDGAGRFLFGLRGVEGSTELEISSAGAAFAYRVSPAFSLGFSAASTRLAWNSEVRRFDSESLRSRDQWTNRQELIGEDDDLTASVGFQWRLGEHVHFGGVYRRGPEFEIATSNTLGPATSFNGRIVDEDVSLLKLPDSYGLGLAISSTSFRFLVDWVRVGYSSLTESSFDALSDDAEGNRAAAKLQIEDADELHVGFEFVVSRLANPLSLRIGGYFDPDHKVAFSGLADNISEGVEALIFRPGEDQLHYSAGFGINFQDGRYELNVAADLADRIETVSLSFVTRPF